MNSVTCYSHSRSFSSFYNLSELLCLLGIRLRYPLSHNWVLYLNIMGLPTSSWYLRTSFQGDGVTRQTTLLICSTASLHSPHRWARCWQTSIPLYCCSHFLVNISMLGTFFDSGKAGDFTILISFFVQQFEVILERAAIMESNLMLKEQNLFHFSLSHYHGGLHRWSPN